MTAGSVSGETSARRGEVVGLPAGVKDEHRLLAPEHVAVALSISREHVFKLMRSGDLPFVRVGRFYRVTANDLQQFITTHRAVSSPPVDVLRVRVRTASST